MRTTLLLSGASPVLALFLMSGAMTLSGSALADVLAIESRSFTPQMTCEAPGVDTDLDGVCDDVDLDDDNDGMPDAFESANRLDSLDPRDALADLDLDGASNLAEFRAGSDPDDALAVPDSVRSTTTVASVLPLSRSASVGTPVTVFATLLNAGSTELTGCTVAPAAPLATEFFFSATDAATNAVVGQPNDPVTIAAGASQSFVLGFTPFEAFSAVDVEFRFECENVAPVSRLPGINTLTLSASLSPTADVIALAATAGTPGVLSIADVSVPGAFAVASVNVGAADAISVSAQPLNGAQLPVTLSVCETDPSTGACVNPTVPAESASLNVAENATPTFSVFVAASDEVALDPGANRIGVTFSDSSGAVRGSTSVAIQASVPDLTPAFSEVQEVFTQNCAFSGCHNAASRRAGLSLEAPAFANIVGVSSSQMPQLSRIQAGNASDSYLIRKLEGGPGIAGQQMPLGRAPLTQQTIELIRAWVEGGAPSD